MLKFWRNFFCDFHDWDLACFALNSSLQKLDIVPYYIQWVALYLKNYRSVKYFGSTTTKNYIFNFHKYKILFILTDLNHNYITL